MTCQVMGVLNVTPDSFSDGGNYVELDRALTHAREMIAAGATIIDVGGESTRPGADRITPEEEQRRVLPIIEALVSEGATVSIDTVNADTAQLAVAAGARIINDVSGGTADPRMRTVAAKTGATFVIMHWRGIPDLAHSRSSYSDVVEEVRAELGELAQAALDAGVAAHQIVLDPGLGFDKTAEQGWQLIAGIERLQSLGYPVLVGISRKRMLRDTLDSRLPGEPEMRDRDVATAVVSVHAAKVGAWGVRVHDVRTTTAALTVSEAIQAAEGLRAFDKLRGSGGLQVAQASTSSASSSVGVEAAARGGESKAGDRISLIGLEVFAHHGVFDFERERGQRFIIDAEILVDLRAAAAGDELAATVNYAELADAIVKATESDPVDLIETLAERIAQVALQFGGVQQTTITVHKPDAPIDATFADVAVTITRESSDFTGDRSEPA